MDAIYKLIQHYAPKIPDLLALALAVLLPIAIVMGVFLTVFALLTWVERKALGRIQNRRGPNRVGPVGLFQPVADGLKLLTKEDIVPAAADKVVHFLAPVLTVVPAFMVLAVVPVAKGFVPVDLNIGVLFALAVSTGSVLALFMAGWASRNKFSLLGAMRSVAQVVSYEVPMVMAAVVILMAAGTLSSVGIVEAQRGLAGWFVFKPWGLVAFVIFQLCAMAEVARTPFDLPEAESEIVAGYHTEYSGFKFALFQMGEYVAAITMGGITVTMFLGGYLGPGSDLPKIGWLVSAGWFFAKLGIIVVINIWARGTWPRVRVDQLLGFAWKLLLPLALVNIVAMAIWHFASNKLVGWGASAVVLAVAIVALVKINTGQTFEKRSYRFIS
ncbi:MAG: NADH-quinone oxidoreductase subunit NuoH [Verrucomicrobia bacterium]|nr:NADH-quinone oxidoreductase subunit NuoH [Verrucomicrobiota bacterium]